MRKANIAQCRLQIEGPDPSALTDLTDRIDPRLISLQLTESREEKADKLDLVLNNADGQLAPLRKGVVLTLALGWKQGEDVPLGLVDKGRFTVDEVTKEGPPDKVSITARSADLTGAYRKRRDKIHKNTTLGAVVTRIARANGLTARIHPSLSAKPIEVAEQAGRSDMAFVMDLGKRFDATATVKDKTLIFAPVGKGQVASGRALPVLALARTQTTGSWRFTSSQRGKYDGAEAQYHDRGAARRRTAKVGSGNNPKRLRKVYANQADAQAAAQSEHQRHARGENTFSCDMAYGDAAVIPERPVTLSGWDSEIDGISWVIKTATHSFGAEGLRTKLELETKV